MLCIALLARIGHTKLRAIAVAEIKLRKVAMKMLLGAVLRHAKIEVEALNEVRANDALALVTNVFFA